ncbi:benzoate 4-monooxygenase cytochrome P450 [Annulohypoxylon maeteangense]|uniref:benzoate 4-monooxygenase cytochrome P450 n=1 Tax=Annulohypoxylon maeteangense TaxID=1927788 RepID=UPI0020074A7F|nr:benzoate 4-monooxygenase cytochrome P450 [Annulohypoxylon maeteangense]KAI0885722.1 benzoate 4-monooxygenase cytochrome P450 [Annulohypoxylon maeteangense]
MAHIMPQTSANVILPFLLGVSMHHGVFIHGEWHNQAPSIVVSHFSFLFVLLAFRIVRGSGAVFQIVVETALSTSIYFLGLFLSIAMYRLFFHRLKAFPGSRLASLSKLWHVWMCRTSKGHRVLQAWQQQYGSIVRTGPNEVTLFHPAAFEFLDGIKNENTRSDWHDILHPKSGAIFTRDKNAHKARKRVWESALGSGALIHHYESLKRHVQVLESMVSEYSETPVVVNDLLHWFAFDSMGDYGFGQDFGLMRERKWSRAAINLHSSLSVLGYLSPAIWVCILAFFFMPGLWKVKHWFQMIEFGDNCVEKRKKQLSGHVDIVSAFIRDYEKHREDEIYNPDMTLSGEAAILLVSASETIAPTLTTLLYFLARHPEHAAKIQKELEDVDTTDPQALSVLPHLAGTINEAMRLLPAVMSCNPGSRVSPPQGLNIDGTFIPGGVKLCASRYSIGRLESAFEDAESFIPERWYSRPELIKDRRAFVPFGVGRTSCVGRNVALATLRLVTARFLSKYHIRFAPGEGISEAVERDLKDGVVSQPGKLVLVFKSRTSAQD